MKRSKKIKNNYRSKFEENFAKSLDVPFRYEALSIPYTVEKTYTPDFDFGLFIVETKGRFLGSDRTKHLRVREQNPDYDIRFVFMNPKVRLSKSSKTTYADWCDKHNFLWADRKMPREWLRELNKQPTKKGKTK